MLTIANRPQGGPLFKPAVLNKVASLFFAPRISRTIRIKEVGLEVRELHIPLENESLYYLDPRLKEQFRQKLEALCRKLGIESLGISRVLRPGIMSPRTVEGRRGDYFIISLALLRLEEMLECIRAQRVILVSDQELAYTLAVEISERFKLPVFLQTANPRQHEPAVLTMLRQQGLALSLALLKPAGWKEDDIIFILDEKYRWCQGDGSRDTKTGVKRTVPLTPLTPIDLSDGSEGQAPELEVSLQEQGLNPALHHLAPLMEAYLLDGKDGEPQGIIKHLEEEGARVWDYFLDKVWDAHYNTIQGFERKISR